MQEKLENVIYIEIQDALFSSLPFPGKFPPLFSISAILLSAYIGLQVSIRFLSKCETFPLHSAMLPGYLF